MTNQVWDVVIIGAGSAGCVLANRLTHGGRHRVLLIEAGGSDRSPLLAAPAATAFWVIGNPRFDWRFPIEPDPSRDGRTEFWPRGKVIGGSSSINGTIFLRGNRADYDHWAQLGNRGWSWDDVLPYFRRLETNERGADDLRGGDGPIHVGELRGPTGLPRAFIAAAAATGIPASQDLNGAVQEGVALIQATQRRGRRWSAARGYLRPALSRPNLQLVARALVTCILFDGRRAVGVAYEQDGQPREARARRVILAAGAIGSPHLLLLSGVGPAAHLSQHGIAVNHDLPGVGRNLQEHVAASLVYRTNVRTLNREAKGLGLAKHALLWAFFGRGAGTSPGTYAVALVRTRPELASPDIQIYFDPWAASLGDCGGNTTMAPYDAIMLTPAVTRSASRGHLDLRSADPKAPPRIHPRLLEAPEDVAALRRGIALSRRIAATPPLADRITELADPDPKALDDPAATEAFLRANAVPTQHPCGTCKMGSDAMAVVGDRLRVRGLEGLWVVDASVMPQIPSSNINAPTLMIGEKGADLLLADMA